MSEDVKKIINSIKNLLPLLFIVLILSELLLVSWNNSLSFDNYLSVIKALIWPSTIILLSGYFFQHEIKSLLNRITGGKLPGGLEFSATQSSDDETPTTSSESGLLTTNNEDFQYLRNFLVPNSKAALKWFFDQKPGATIDAFNSTFIFPGTVITGEIIKEKHVIFSVLLSAKLIESTGNNLFKTSRKGEAFLKFIDLIPR